MKFWQYILGSRKGKDAHNIELEAMRDPFMADALEGLNATDDNYIRSIEKLRKQVSAQSKQKSNNFKALSIAAGILLVVGIGTFVLLNQLDFSSSTQHLPVSVNETACKEKDSIAPFDSIAEKKGEDILAHHSQKDEQPAKAKQAENTPPVILNTPHIEEMEEQSITGISIAGKENNRQQETAQATATAPEALFAEQTPPTSTARMKTTERAETTDTEPIRRNIKGKVIDANGEPIIGATVSMAGTNHRTYTDMNGEFELSVQEEGQLIVRYMGYEPVSIVSNAHASMLIAMKEEQTALDEVVAVAYGAQKKSVISEPAKTPQPVDGNKSYRKYLEKNMIRPTDECAEMKGEVILSFNVNQEGRPYNIKVTQSLCSSADKEAIRLVQDGPNWTTDLGNATVKVKF